MKKIIILLSLIFVLISCNNGEKQKENVGINSGSITNTGNVEISKKDENLAIENSGIITNSGSLEEKKVSSGNIINSNETDVYFEGVNKISELEKNNIKILIEKNNIKEYIKNNEISNGNYKARFLSGNIFDDKIELDIDGNIKTMDTYYNLLFKNNENLKNNCKNEFGPGNGYCMTFYSFIDYYENGKYLVYQIESFEFYGIYIIDTEKKEHIGHINYGNIVYWGDKSDYIIFKIGGYHASEYFAINKNKLKNLRLGNIKNEDKFYNDVFIGMDSQNINNYNELEKLGIYKID